MTKSRTYKILAVVLLLAVLGAIAVSQTIRRAHMRGAGMFGGGMMSFHHLDLTDAQRTQMKSIMAKEKPTFQPLMQQMAQNRMQMQQLVMSSGFDEAKVRELAGQQAQAMTELMVQRARVQSEMLQVLTPEQKTKLTALTAAHQQRMMNHWQKPAQEQAPSQ